MKNIHKYLSYRQFLKDSFLAEKSSSRGVTLANYAKVFGLGASTFKMIMTGERNLTIANIHAIARAMKMYPAERDYFEALVLWEQSSNRDSKSYYSRRMKSLLTSKSLEHFKVSDRRLLFNSLAPVLLLYLIDIEGVGKEKRLEDINEQTVARKFNISLDEVRSTLIMFNELDLFAIDAEGKFHFAFEKVSHHLDEKKYVINEIEETAKRAEKEFADPNTFFRAFTLTMNVGDLPSLRADLMSLLDSYMAKTLSSDKTKVIEKVVISAFPVFYS